MKKPSLPVTAVFEQWLKQATPAELNETVKQVNSFAAALNAVSRKDPPKPRKKFLLTFGNRDSIRDVEFATRTEAEKAILRDFLDHGKTSTLERAIRRNKNGWASELVDNWSVKLKP